MIRKFLSKPPAWRLSALLLLAAICGWIGWQRARQIAEGVATRQLVTAVLAHDVSNVRECLRDGGNPNAGTEGVVEAEGMFAFVKTLFTPNRRRFKGDSLLAAAIDDGQTDIARALLEGGADPASPNHKDTPAIICAAREGNSEVVTLLLDKGANPNSRDKEGVTPLHAALFAGHPATGRLLIARGASIHNTSLDGSTILMGAARSGDMETLMACVEAGVPINGRTKTQQTALHFAASCESVAPMQYLLSRGAKIDAVDVDGSTPLHVACAYEKTLMGALQLLENSANPRIRDRVLNEPVHVLVNARIPRNSTYYRVLDTLLRKGADLTSKGNYGASPLIMASSAAGATQEISWLLNRGSKVNQQTLSGQTALHAVALYGDPQEARLLLRRGAGLNIRDKSGDSPLAYACLATNIGVARALLAAGADPNLPDNLGATPLQCARRNVNIKPEWAAFVAQAERARQRKR